MPYSERAKRSKSGAFLASFAVPDGHDHWTLRLLAGKAVELEFVESISPETIRQLLKKTNSNPGNTVRRFGGG
ncbi:helix-turn-helix domain-containing protein [Ktedonobacter robiniae]